jgi:hypothetical protein
VNRRIVANTFVALAIVGVVGAVFFLEWTDGRGGDSAPTESPTTISPTNSSTTTSPPTTLAPTTLEPSTLAPTTLAPTTIVTTTLAPTTLAPTTVPPTTIATTTTVAPPPQEFIPVVVSNAGTVGERVGLTLFRLAELGYRDARGLNATVPQTDTIVYYQPEWYPAAERLALELGLAATAIAPIESAPPVAGLDNALLLVYLGGA